MGNRLTEENKESPQTSPTPYGDIFDELVPHYLAMGMSWDEYWDGEYGTKKAFRKAYKLRMERDMQSADLINWYMGQYIMSALHAVPLLVAGFNVKNTTKLPEYPAKPFLIKAEEQKKEDVRKKSEEDQSKLAMALFQTMTTKFNKNMEDKSKKQATGSGQ